MLCTQILFLFCFDIQDNFGTQHVLQMLRASEKDFPVRFLMHQTLLILKINLPEVVQLESVNTRIS
jgi:hypothetical protein